MAKPMAESQNLLGAETNKKHTNQPINKNPCGHLARQDHADKTMIVGGTSINNYEVNRFGLTTMKNREQILKNSEKRIKYKPLPYRYVYIQCLRTLALLLWVIGAGEGRVRVKRVDKCVTIIQVRSKIWIWLVILHRKCKK